MLASMTKESRLYVGDIFLGDIVTTGRPGTGHVDLAQELDRLLRCRVPPLVTPDIGGEMWAKTERPKEIKR